MGGYLTRAARCANGMILERRAFHEAGHAVSMWRAQCDLFNLPDDPGFVEIVVGSFDETEAGPLQLADGQTHETGGVMAGAELLFPAGMLWEIREAARTGALTKSEARAEIRRCQALAEVQAMIFLAGPGAECRLQGSLFNWREHPVRSDISRAAGIAAEVCRRLDERSRYLDRAAVRINEFMARPSAWAAVSSLAGALIQQNRLPAHEALRIVNRAWDAAGRHTHST